MLDSPETRPIGSGRVAGDLPCFHVGFHKSASTTLQRHLFARHPQVMNVGRPQPDPRAFAACDAALSASLRDVSERRPLDVASNQALWREVAEEARTAGKRLVLSRERLTRYYFFESPSDTRLPESLFKIVGPARIVIVVRHQLRLLESLYLHKAKISKYLDARSWLETNSGADVHMHKYFEVAESYGSVFGRDNVLVLMLEQLIADPVWFAHTLCDFIGIDPEIGQTLIVGRRENVRRSARSLVYSRIRSLIFPQTPLSGLLPNSIADAWRAFVNAGPKADFAFPDDWRRRIEDFYREDNRLLASRYGLPLAQYQYPL